MEVRSEEAQGFDMTLSRTIPGPLMCLTMAILLVFFYIISNFWPLGCFSYLSSLHFSHPHGRARLHVLLVTHTLSFTSVLRSQHRCLVVSCVLSRETRVPRRVMREPYSINKSVFLRIKFHSERFLESELVTRLDPKTRRHVK